MNNKIVHLSDIHIRNQSRKEEYFQVFNRLIEDVKKEKPRMIVFTGDLMHMKTILSPTSIELAAFLLTSLSEICDIFLTMGNHDTLIGNPSTGDAISPIIDLMDNGIIVSKGTRELFRKETENTIFFFKESGFYNFEEIVFGVFSCWDQEMLKLETREPNKKYIALHHGPIHGARMDNGHEYKKDNSVKCSTFDGFDMVYAGDFHTEQIVQEYSEKNLDNGMRQIKPAIKFSGSLLQQNYGENIDKGYILWNLDDFASEFKHIPNDFGFAKITIAKGERFEERIEHIKFSNNKKKTKVYVVWEDYEENFSQEKENQIVRLIKDRHGCEVVKVQFESLVKEIIVDEEAESNLKESEQYLLEFLESANYNCSKEEVSDLIAFHRETNKLCELVEEKVISASWKLNRFEASNIFSLPVQPIIIDFDDLGGITGIFGKNYNGKSNIIKAIVWGLFKEILGGGDPKYIVNLYTDSNKGFVKFWITIDGKKYYIERTVKTTRKKDGTTSNSYSVKYKTLELEYDEDGNLDNEKWENEKSDEATAEQNEVGNLIENAIGTFDDFTKTSLQTQGGKDDYLSMNQQPKNILINKYLGLESYKIRYEFRNEFFKDIKKKQKELGDKLPIEDKLRELNEEKNFKRISYDACIHEKNTANEKKDNIDVEILELTKKLERLEIVSQTDINLVQRDINNYEIEMSGLNDRTLLLNKWLAENFKKELPFEESVTLDSLKNNLNNAAGLLSKDELEKKKSEDWMVLNPEKKEINIHGFDKDIEDLIENISTLKVQLQIFKGKNCPTCGSIQQIANPEKEEECIDEIKMKEEVLDFKRKKIKESQDVIGHNAALKNISYKIETLCQGIKNHQDKIISLTEKIELFNKSKDIIAHNNEVEAKAEIVKKAQQRIETLRNLIKELKESINKIKINDERKKNNKIIQENIDSTMELSRAYKITVFNMDNQATGLFGDIRVLENSINSYEQKILDITEYEKKFRKYSIYLQAMHKDGIPALIIRKKLPLINNRINSILQEAVDFKIELSILENGDIAETFYFNDDKSDSLPLSFASGSQKFVSLISIKDSLHHFSTLTKPSLCIIDEGFGTLDDELTFEIMNILNYLKNKHKNVIVITHRSEIKEFADNIIEVTKVRTGLTQEVLDKNPKAGITTINIL